MLRYEGGAHDRAMRYIVRLRPPDHTEAWLQGRFDDRFNDCGPEQWLLCAVDASSRNKLADCAEALWRDGVDPDSELQLWWGEDAADRSTPDRTCCSDAPDPPLPFAPASAGRGGGPGSYTISRCR
jgi:hypothetical protein